MVTPIPTAQSELLAWLQTLKSQGYDFRVDDDLHAIWMEHAADVHVELVKLVDGLSSAHIPQHAVIQHQVVCWVEGGTVPLVVVGQVRVVQSLS